MDEQKSETEHSDAMILDHDAKVRRSFDPHISSLALRAITNDPANGYSLASTVGFGSELVNIRVDDEEIAFRLEIYRAELVMNPANCIFDPEFERDSLESQPATTTDREESALAQKSTRFRLETADLISEITGVKAEIEHSHDRTLQEALGAWYQIRFLDDYTVQFSSKGGYERTQTPRCRTASEVWSESKEPHAARCRNALLSRFK